MKSARQNIFVRSLLRVIDICVAIYSGRSVHWKEEPFRKTTGTQWRTGWLFVACLPIFMLVFTCNNSVNSFIEHTGNGGHSIAWLYAGFIGIVLVGGLLWIKIGPKIPLYFSIPTAITAWIYCIWLLGFHSEKIIHSS